MTSQTAPILNSWDSFNKQVLIPRNTPPALTELFKDTFFSGAFSCFQACMQAGQDEATATKTLEAINSEMETFLEEKMRGLVLAMLKGEKNEH